MENSVEMEVIREQAKVLQEAIDTRLNSGTPVNHLTVEDEVYQLVADHSAMKEIASRTGIHPYVDGNLTRVLNLPDGLETCLYAMLVKPGPKHQLPEKQRRLTLKKIASWFSEAEDEFEFWQRAGDAVFMTFLQDTKRKNKPVEVAETEPDPTVNQQT